MPRFTAYSGGNLVLWDSWRVLELVISPDAVTVHALFFNVTALIPKMQTPLCPCEIMTEKATVSVAFEGNAAALTGNAVIIPYSFAVFAIHTL